MTINVIINGEAGNSVRSKLNQVITVINDGLGANTILNGEGAPNNALGNDGDFYLNTANLNFYGPKVSGVWGGFVSLIGPTGATGPEGPQGAGINPTGEYNAGTAYAIGDLVSYLGSSYIALTSTTGNLPTNVTYWQVVANKGETGSISSASTLNLSEQVSTPTTPAAGTWEIYPKADGFYVLNDAGNETQLGGSTPAATNVNAQVGTTYTLALEDTDGVVTMNNASPNTLIIPTEDAVPFPDGTWVEVWQIGSGDTKIEAPSVTLNWAASNGQCFVGGEWASVLLRKVGPDVWLIKPSGVASVSQPS